MNKKYLKKIKLPNTPGVYFFCKGKDIIYIGKATSLSNRVKSYFSKDLIATRGPLILDMVTIANSIKWKETDSVLEALILEANLIKKYQPKYNTKEKDNKSFNYVCITKEELPKVLVVRGRGIFSQQHTNSSRLTLKGSDTDKNLYLASKKYQSIFGPFPNGLQLKEAMRIIRRIFPFIDDQSSKKNNREFYKQLGLTPSVTVSGDGRKKSSFSSWSGSSSSLIRGPEEKKLFSDRQNEYKNNIKNLKLFFQGKKKSVVINLKKEMFSFAKKKEFEKAGEIKKRIFALEHINDVALIKEEIFVPQIKLQNFRVEAYDIAHLFGKNMVGVMTVMENSELVKNEYRKFIIRTQDKSNDIGALEEIISRRLRHSEWGLPSLIVMDGSTAQINIAKSVLDRYQFKIPVVSVVKDDKHKAKAIIGDEKIIKKYKKEILLINNESHRFAISFHKNRRDKNFLNHTARSRYF